ncbi:MAG: hypothetical protein LC115_06940 [Bacteroidia bacterium]|nr:hypothetical protein [Bacteroidia bacterium]
MSKMIEVRLVQLSCVTQTESDGDEIYFLTSVNAPSFKNTIQERTPKGTDFIPMKNGSVIQNYEHNLFYGESEKEMQITVILMEMDMVSLVNNNISIISKWIDDTLGAVSILISSEDNIQVTAGKNSTVSLIEGNQYKSTFNGSKGNYEATFEITLK